MREKYMKADLELAEKFDLAIEHVSWEDAERVGQVLGDFTSTCKRLGRMNRSQPSHLP